MQATPPTTKHPAHPAKFTDAILTECRRALPPDRFRFLVDPFAGTGRIHELRDDGHDTLGVEIEAEWAGMHEGTVCADARNLGSYVHDGEVDAICVSPTFGNRLADDHEPSPEDTSERHTYRHTLGRPLSAGNSGGMQWGPEYRILHEAVWAACVTALRIDGRFVLNIKDHVRGGVVQPVSGWHVTVLCRLGLRVVSMIRLDARGQRHGANGAARVDHEWIIVLVKERPPEQTLFDIETAVPVVERFVRPSDPSTSHAGADGVVVRAHTQLAQLLVAFSEAPDFGLTSEEAGNATMLSEYPSCCYWRRVSSLRQQGWLEATTMERPSSAGAAQRVLVCTPRGFVRAAELVAEGQTKYGWL